MIVGSVSSEVYRRIDEHVRKGAGADGQSQPENAAVTAAEQNMNMTGRTTVDRRIRPRQRAPSLARVAGRREGPGRLLEREARIRGLLARNRQADRARRIHARMVRRARMSGVQDRTEKRRDRASRVPRLGQVTRERPWKLNGAALGSPLLILRAAERGARPSNPNLRRLSQ